MWTISNEIDFSTTNGRIATNHHRAYALYASWFQDLEFYGNAGPTDERDTSLVVEALAANEIEIFFYWSTDPAKPAYLEGYELVATRTDSRLTSLTLYVYIQAGQG